MELKYFIFGTSPGWVGVLGTSDGLRKLVLPQPSAEHTMHLLDEFVLRLPGATLREEGSDYFADLPERMRGYLDSKPIDFPNRLDLSWAGSFQRSVWRVARLIPYGETRTYAWVAGKLGMPRAARAVGQALAQNPLPVIIPCHRVIHSDGKIGGFSGGRGWKQRLLDIEM